jgi:CRISPR-associated endonuclease/helicase Cas3
MDTTEASRFFDDNFPLLAGNCSPYSWQRELFMRFVSGEYPTEIDLPTGTGKTSLMDVWFLALTHQALEGQVKIPRRLVWVVNRRVVVDQATNRAMTIAGNAVLLPPVCKKALSNLSVSGYETPAISTLRGEKADNREWTKDPSRPAIVIGTVDMIGSRLLFSGYGDGNYFRPQHAGLLAVDTLVVNDEAHLTPAFIHLLEGISQRQPARRIPSKNFRYLSLSATHAWGEVRNRFPLSLDSDMAASEAFRTRVTGHKQLSLYEVADNKKLESMMFDLAVQPGAARTIVYVEQPEKALAMFRRIKKLHPDRVELLTGTMRGYERDRLLTQPVFKAMLLEEPPAEQTWLVATSAGEVGVDITSERQVSSLVTADHLIQRFGRLNRFGSGHGHAHVIYTKPKEKETALLETLEYLQGLPDLDGHRDIRCLSLRQKPPDADAQTGLPKLADLHDWLIELWCQTSDPVKGYPPVESWLHGSEENEGPETEIAWRADVEALSSEDVPEQQRKLALRFYPVRAREKLREPTRRIKDKLKKLAETQSAAKVLIRRKDRSISVTELRDIEGAELDYALIILPLNVGELIRGMLWADTSESSDPPSDVADSIDVDERKRERWLGVRGEHGSYQFTRFAVPEEPVPVDDLEDALIDFAERRGMRIVLQVPLSIPEDGGDPCRVLIYLRQRPELNSSSKPVYLEPHCNDVSSLAGELAERLVPGLAALYREAGRLHDTGKGRNLWQRVMGNNDPSVKIAKPIRFAKGGAGLGGYRHELGSLVQARGAGGSSPTNSESDLLLHLIASHHGHARPHFPANAHDVERFKDSGDAMAESVDRFGRLTDEWGPWGLAYIEAIFKAADGIASSQAEEQPDDEH